MKMLRQILQWIRQELFFDLNRVYKNDIRIPPKNRHARRLQAKKDKCLYWNFFHGRPWYKWRVIMQVRMIHWLVTRLKN